MNYICIGKIVNTHGIKGEVKIQSYSDFDSERYKKGNTVYINYENQYLPFIVKTFRVHKGHSLVSFDEYSNINDVEKYKGHMIYISEEERKPLKNGQYYRNQIIGLNAKDTNGHLLGKVISIEETTGAQNNIRIKTETMEEFLVPYIPEFIQSVDLDNQVIVIAMQEGLL